MNKHFHFHRRNLPHIYAPELTYFITFRLKDSLSYSKLRELKNRREFTIQPKSKEEKYHFDKKFFYEYDKLLHRNFKQNSYLKIPRIANIVKTEIHKYDNKDYNLICYSIMPNHVHLVFTLIEKSRTIDKIMQNIKRISAYYSNRYLKRKGAFWQSESYDHIVRDEDELNRIIEYTLMNPVKASLVEKWEEWEDNYLKE